MISASEVEIIHNTLIDKFGGAKGIRDLGLLESALARPFATFNEIDVYTKSCRDYGKYSYQSTLY